jgi:carbon-monoxide dehydrogenase medium subunit
MKPPPFLYCRPATLEEALALLAEHGDEAKALAGGQSLMPLLNFRLARPSVLVDLCLIQELQGVSRREGELVVGAMVVQRRAERDAQVGAACPLIPAALRHVGHLQIRNRGTVGGSLAHADPAAELPSVALATEATMVVRSSRGVRTIPAAEFFQGPFMTALDPEELLVEARFPVLDGSRTAFLELARRSGDFAMAGVAAVVTFDSSERVAKAGLAGLGVGATPIRLAGAEAALADRALTEEAIASASAAASAEVRPMGDVHADEEYRRHLVGVLLGRALRQIGAGTEHGTGP